MGGVYKILWIDGYMLWISFYKDEEYKKSAKAYSQSLILFAQKSLYPTFLSNVGILENKILLPLFSHKWRIAVLDISLWPF